MEAKRRNCQPAELGRPGTLDNEKGWLAGWPYWSGLHPIEPAKLDLLLAGWALEACLQSRLGSFLRMLVLAS